MQWSQPQAKPPRGRDGLLFGVRKVHYRWPEQRAADTEAVRIWYPKPPPPLLHELSPSLPPSRSFIQKRGSFPKRSKLIHALFVLQNPFSPHTHTHTTLGFGVVFLVQRFRRLRWRWNRTLQVVAMKSREEEEVLVGLGGHIPYKCTHRSVRINHPESNAWLHHRQHVMVEGGFLGT